MHLDYTSLPALCQVVVVPADLGSATAQPGSRCDVGGISHARSALLCQRLNCFDRREGSLWLRLLPQCLVSRVCRLHMAALLSRAPAHPPACTLQACRHCAAAPRNSSAHEGFLSLELHAHPPVHWLLAEAHGAAGSHSGQSPPRLCRGPVRRQRRPAARQPGGSAEQAGPCGCELGLCRRCCTGARCSDV